MDLGVADALSGTAATGLILGAGALGSGLLVVGLTVLAVRRGNREEELRRRGTARPERRAKARTAARAGGRRAARPEPPIVPGAHDPYPRQPYSATEPGSHQPYSRPYKLPRQDSLGATNGHLKNED